MIDLITDRRTCGLDGGFEVGRVLPFAKQRMAHPFIFFDQMGPVDFAAGIPSASNTRECTGYRPGRRGEAVRRSI